MHETSKVSLRVHGVDLASFRCVVDANVKRQSVRCMLLDGSGLAWLGQDRVVRRRLEGL